jgi:hypothetical protein
MSATNIAQATLAPPHGIGRARWPQVALAFAAGGLVSVYEADAFLRLERGTVLREVLAGRMPHVARPRGRKTRYFVRASDASALFGVHGQLSIIPIPRKMHR